MHSDSKKTPLGPRSFFGSPSEEQELAGSPWVKGFMRKTRANRGGVIWKMRVYGVSPLSITREAEFS